MGKQVDQETCVVKGNQAVIHMIRRSFSLHIARVKICHILGNLEKNVKEARSESTEVSCSFFAQMAQIRICIMVTDVERPK